MLLRRRGTLRKEPRQERSSFTFEAILDAAQLLLVSSPGSQLQMATLAKRAGVSVGSLYQYFPDRVAVLIALLDRVWDRAARDFRLRLPGLEVTSLESLIDEMGGLVAELAFRDHPLRVAVHAELRREGSGAQQIDVSREWVTYLGDWIRPHLGETDPPTVILIARGMVWTADGIIDGAALWEELTVSELKATICAAWRGLVSLHR